jgi:prophage tail gpP-like protein
MNSPASLKTASRITLEIGGSTAGQLIRGEKLSGFSSLQVQRSIDAAAGAFSFTIPWEPTPENIRRFHPMAFSQVQVYLDDELILTGYIEKVSPVSGSEMKEINIQGRSVTGVLTEWSAGPPFEFENVSFNTVASKLAFPYSVYISINGNRSDTPAIPTVEFEPGESIFAVLSSLASASGYFAQPAPNGALEFTRFGKSNPVVTLEEGSGPVREVSVNFDATKLAHEYLVIASSEGNPEISANVIDKRAPRNIRGKRIISPSQQSTDYTQAANLLRSRALIDCFRPVIAVTGWNHPGGSWKGGEIVQVKAPSAYILKFSPLIVSQAVLEYDTSQGELTRLELALPEAYSNQYPEVVPWEY